MEVQMKQRFVIKFLYVEKMALFDIHEHLFVSGDQTVDVSIVRQWVVHSSSGDSGSPLLVQIFMCGIQDLVHTWQKCRDNGGDYVE